MMDTDDLWVEIARRGPEGLLLGRATVERVTEAPDEGLRTEFRALRSKPDFFFFVHCQPFVGFI